MNRTVADMLEENQRQRYLARREASRRRGLTHASTRVPTTPGGASQSPVTRHLSPMPGLLILSLISSLGLLVLAVVGAYAVIRTVLGQ